MKGIIIITYLLASRFFFLSGQSPYNYPVVPGTESWKKLKNHNEKVLVCQIPDSILRVMSTEDLMETCLNYPLLLDIFAFDFVQDGINTLKRNFNGINEFFMRDDCSKILINKYRNISPLQDMNGWTRIEKGLLTFKIMDMELLLSQEEVFSVLTLDQKKDVIKLMLRKNEEKKDNEIYGLISLVASCYAMSNIILSEKQSFLLVSPIIIGKIERFKNKGSLADTSLVSDITYLANEFIK